MIPALRLLKWIVLAAVVVMLCWGASIVLGDLFCSPNSFLCDNTRLPIPFLITLLAIPSYLHLRFRHRNTLSPLFCQPERYKEVKGNSFLYSGVRKLRLSERIALTGAAAVLLSSFSPPPAIAAVTASLVLLSPIAVFTNSSLLLLRGCVNSFKAANSQPAFPLIIGLHLIFVVVSGYLLFLMFLLLLPLLALGPIEAVSWTAK
jgi:hypothetical protein